jgi:hypothetical protein
MQYDLPGRRHSLIREIWWNGNRVHVAVGLNPEYSVCEVFAHGPKSGTEAWAMLQDACVFLSRRRRAGETFKDMIPGVLHGENGEPLSIMGAVLEVAAEVEKELS